MSAVQFYLPYDIAIKPTNVGAPGAKLYVYAPSTTTKRPVYATSALTTQLANPVTADGAGKFPAIYLDNAFTYKIVINDKNGAPLYQRDPYIPGMAPDSAALAPYQSAAAAAAASVGTDAVTAAAAASTASTAAAAAQAYLASLTTLPTQGLGLTAASRVSLAMLATTTPAILAESGREGVFVFDGANHSAQVTADPRQGIYVARSSDATGATGAWVRKYPGSINVKWFGAKGDSNATGTVGTDDTAAIQAAITYIASLGGGTLYFPEGFYKVTSYLTLCANIVILGAGRKAARIVATQAGGGGASADQNLRNGSVFYSNWPSNSSSHAFITVEGIGFIASDAANVGAAFYDNGGSYITIRGCSTSGFKHGVVFDQTELGDVYDCCLEPRDGGGTCVWLVNGGYLKAGNSTGFTNRISVKACQLNAGITVNLILDDGGANHTFQDNNYNGGLHNLVLNGSEAFVVIGGEWEGASDYPIYLNFLASDGATGVGGSVGTFVGSMLSTTGAGMSPVYVNSSGRIAFAGVAFTGSAYPVAGAGNAASLSFRGCTSSRADRAFVDVTSSELYIDEAPEPIKTNFSLTALDLTFTYINARIRCSNASAFAGKLMADTASPIPLGAYILLEQTTSSVVSFVADTGVTITGPLATTVQGQLLRALKVAANAWVTQLIVPNPLTPPSLAATGDISTSGGKIGYATGAGGTATQATSKATGVALNKVTGDITMNAAALAAGAIVSFVQTNTTVVASDIIDVRHQSGGTLGAYGINAVAGAGTITYYVRNNTAGPLSEALVLRYTARSAATA
jgi:hypothetical protein